MANKEKSHLRGTSAQRHQARLRGLAVKALVTPAIDGYALVFTNIRGDEVSRIALPESAVLEAAQAAKDAAEEASAIAEAAAADASAAAVQMTRRLAQMEDMLLCAQAAVAAAKSAYRHPREA